MIEKLTNRPCSLWWLDDSATENELTDFLSDSLDMKIVDTFVQDAYEHMEFHRIHLDYFPEKSSDDETTYIWVLRYPGMTVGHIEIVDGVITTIMIYEKPDMQIEMFDKTKLLELTQFVGSKIDVIGG